MDSSRSITGSIILAIAQIKKGPNFRSIPFPISKHATDYRFCLPYCVFV